MNKQHWNTVEINGSIPDGLIKQLIDESYESIIKSLLVKKRQEIFKKQ
jgi:predicted DNA-binding protein (MmcQ/YjbR family)